ncbi:hypothetical protein TcWFU_002045 [Taenia crassiceps]|uniref:Uncharacterized protein n=1 Tax=Taenia crassiceps TaxID=6207 RepID=A0ABR4QJG8_9CEST
MQIQQRQPVRMLLGTRFCLIACNYRHCRVHLQHFGHRMHVHHRDSRAVVNRLTSLAQAGNDQVANHSHSLSSRETKMN